MNMHKPLAISELSAVTEADFKETMRRFASTVNVITSASGGTLNGMTATAVCSVSVEPPSILVVVNRKSRSHALIAESGAFAVNMLSGEQEALARHFAERSDFPFATVSYRLGVTRAPILRECQTYLECVTASRTEAATHSIFIGKVVACGAGSSRPLLHWNGHFSPIWS